MDDVQTGLVRDLLDPPSGLPSGVTLSLFVS